MILTNNSKRVICIGKLFIAPGEAKQVEDSIADNQMISAYMQKGILVKGKVRKPVAKKAAVVPALEEASKEDLIALAEEKGIDLTGADTKEEILAIIKEG